MHDFFLSYSSEDIDLAAKIEAAINKSGYSVWRYNNGILPGELTAETIQKALKNVKCLIILISKNSVSSNWVSCELTEAKNNDIPVIPIKLDDTPLPFQLNNTHIEDMRKWKPNTDLPESLLKSLNKFSKNIDGSIKTTKKEIDPSRRRFIHKLTIVGAGGTGMSAGSVLTRNLMSPDPMPPDPLFPKVKWIMNNVLSNGHGFPENSFLVKVGDLLCQKISELTNGQFTITSIQDENQNKPLRCRF